MSGLWFWFSIPFQPGSGGYLLHVSVNVFICKLYQVEIRASQVGTGSSLGSKTYPTIKKFIACLNLVPTTSICQNDICPLNRIARRAFFDLILPSATNATIPVAPPSASHIVGTNILVVPYSESAPLPPPEHHHYSMIDLYRSIHTRPV